MTWMRRLNKLDPGAVAPLAVLGADLCTAVQMSGEGMLTARVLMAGTLLAGLMHPMVRQRSCPMRKAKAMYPQEPATLAGGGSNGGSQSVILVSMNMMMVLGGMIGMRALMLTTMMRCLALRSGVDTDPGWHAGPMVLLLGKTSLMMCTKVVHVQGAVVVGAAGSGAFLEQSTVVPVQGVVVVGAAGSKVYRHLHGTRSYQKVRRI